MRRIAARCSLPAALLVVALASPASASTEEFSTFRVEAQEEDDESLLDHVIARYPHEWESAWKASAQGFRTSQGCLTAGQWLTDAELRLSAPIARSMRFGFEMRQRLSDDVNLEQYDLSWHYLPRRDQDISVFFRPFHDKSRQDFGLSAVVGSDSAGLRVRATFTLEDTFNNLWAFRQTRVGELSEPYRRRPYEPALALQWSRGAWSAGAAGVWLTHSLKSVTSDLVPPGQGEALRTLWGVAAEARAGWEREGTSLRIAARNKQARGTLGSASGPRVEDNYRRQWQAEGAFERPLSQRVVAQGQVFYGERLETYLPIPAPRRFRAVDRVASLGAELHLTDRLGARVGGMLSRLGIEQTGDLTGRIVSPGTRTESRIFLGLNARFGSMWVAITEGFELDGEPYPVWLVHDKTYFQLMTRF